MSSLFQHPAQTRAQVIEAAHEYGLGRPAHMHDDTVGSGFNGPMSPPTHHGHGRSGSMSGKRTQGSKLGAKAGLVPLSASTSAQSGQGANNGSVQQDGANAAGAMSYAQAAHHAVEEETQSSTSTAVSNGNGHNHPHKHDHGKDGKSKLAKDASAAEAGDGHDHAHGHGHDHSHAGHGAQGEEHDHAHDGYGHGGHGHSHGSMNMHGVFLHVLGDA
jgi:zinc transporter 1